MKTATYRGMYIRGDEEVRKFDEDVYKEAHAYFRHLPVSGATVLDIGAHYGMFSSMAIDRGAKEIIAIEPDRFNYELAKKNIEEHSKGKSVTYTICNKAVVANSKVIPELTLYRHKKYTAAVSAFPSIRSKSELEKVIVETVSFSKLLDTYKPSVVKIDCEGCEYDLLEYTLIPDYVEHILIEFHRHRKDLRDRFDEAIAVFNGEEWTCSKQAKPNWHCVTGAWHRK